MSRKITHDVLVRAMEILDQVQVEFTVVQERKEAMYPSLSDAQFARLLGITPATYNDYKSKKAATPSLKVGLKAAFALELDLRSLVSEAEKIKVFFNQNLR